MANIRIAQDERATNHLIDANRKLVGHTCARQFTLRDITVDLSARNVTRGGVVQVLTPQEFALLEALIANRNLTLSRDQLLCTAWGYDCAGESRTVDVHIQHLRRKLGLEQDIQTIYKLGYRLNTQ